MPFIDVLIASHPLDDARLGEIARRLTGLSTRLLGKAEALTAVAVRVVPPQAWFVGGRSLAEAATASFQVRIRVTEGTVDKEQKAAFVAAVAEAMAGLLGPVRPESYVIVDEVPADAWGWSGVTQEHRAIAAKIEREAERATVFDAYRRFGIR